MSAVGFTNILIKGGSNEGMLSVRKVNWRDLGVERANLDG